jgi:cell wall-associated NlpC family hydrolase
MHARGNEIVARALQYVGTPYRHQGRNIDTGVDCIGLAASVARDLGISTYDTTNYTRRPNPRQFRLELLKAGCTRVRLSELENGDIVRMSESPGLPVHIGIFYRDDKGKEFIIHAYTNNGRTGKVRLEEISQDRRSKFTEALRMPE